MVFGNTPILVYNTAEIGTALAELSIRNYILFDIRKLCFTCEQYMEIHLGVFVTDFKTTFVCFDQISGHSFWTIIWFGV